MSDRLKGKRVLVTTADLYVGPPVVDLFGREGADVVADTGDYTQPGTIEDVVSRAGEIDILVANFAGPRRMLPVTKLLTDFEQVKDEDFQAYLDVLVWPMVRFFRAVLPQMIARGSGKICGVTSAAPMRGIPGASVYTAARAAQNGLICALGAEVAPHNVQINAIGPAFIHNNAYIPDEVLADDDLRSQFDSMSARGKMGSGQDAAELVLALTSDASNFLTGQVIPLAGGWVQ